MGDTFLTFARPVLPALPALGVTSDSRLADLAVRDAYYARAIGRIRSFYPDHRTRSPAILGAARRRRRTRGDAPSWAAALSVAPHGHTATSLAAVVGVIPGVFLGLVGSAVPP